LLEAYHTISVNILLKRDGYKLIEAPYTAWSISPPSLTANHSPMAYYERDWTGVGISLRFDFIIIHETATNGRVTGQRGRVSDMWIHERLDHYLECSYVEYMYGKEDGLKYTTPTRQRSANSKARSSRSAELTLSRQQGHVFQKGHCSSIPAQHRGQRQALVALIPILISTSSIRTS